MKKEKVSMDATSGCCATKDLYSASSDIHAFTASLPLLWPQAKLRAEWDWQ